MCVWVLGGLEPIQTLPEPHPDPARYMFFEAPWGMVLHKTQRLCRKVGGHVHETQRLCRKVAVEADWALKAD